MSLFTNVATSTTNKTISYYDLANLIHKIEEDKPKWLIGCNKSCENQVKEIISNKPEFKQYKITVIGTNYVEEGKMFLMPDDREELKV